MNVMDWLAKMLGLPDKFLHHHPDSVGGGVLQVKEIRVSPISISGCTQVISFLVIIFLWGKINEVQMETTPILTFLSQILGSYLDDNGIGNAIAFIP